MSTFQLPTEEEDRAAVTGLMHRFISPEDPSMTYVVSHTGLVVEVITQTGPSKRREESSVTLWVTSMVNGSMAHNPLGEFVCCVNFDEYMMDWFKLPYQQHRVVGVAYFNPATCRYQQEILPYPGQEIHPD